MAKNQSSETEDRTETKRAKAKPRIPPKHKWPKVLFPTEPTSIPRERIAAAVDKVIAARQAAEKAERLEKRKKRNGKTAGRI
jgi:hypothetical protein